MDLNFRKDRGFYVDFFFSKELKVVKREKREVKGLSVLYLNLC